MILNEVTTGMLLALFPDGRLQNDFEIRWTTLLARFDLNFAELTYSAGHVDTPKKETNSEFGFDIGLGPQFSAVVFNQPAESTTHELRLVSTTDNKLQWLTGLFFLDAESNSAGWTDTPDFFFREEISDPIDAEAWAVYGEIEYAFNEQWSAQAGLRYHDEDREYTSIYAIADPFSDPLFGPYSFPDPTTVEKSSFDHISYRLGVNWNPSENGLVYLTHSTANRAPIIQPQSNRIQLENAGITPPGDADAAELANTELGTKWTLLDGRMQLEAAYVHGDWNDMPMWATLNIPPQPLSLTIGGTDAVVETWEFALTWALSDNITFNYAGAFTDTEVKKIPADAAVTGYPPAVKDGGDLFNYSPTTHNFGINYNQALGSSDWEMTGSLNYVTREKPDGINVFDLEATEFVPARDEYNNLAVNLGATKGPWTFTLSVDNATDEDGMFGPSTANQIDGFILAPRTYSLQVIYDGMQ
jgi:outer membrane receptor protein involved in Fe transport